MPWNTCTGKGICDVDFVLCNTDSQILEHSPIPTIIQLGKTLTEGRGAGNRPEIGEAPLTRVLMI